jgi:nitric oxide dioxygenase
MLSKEYKAIISATVPILEQGGEALTRHFYQTMFRDYPQVQPLFNQSNQAEGKQQRALANAVLMYAKNIERLEALGRWWLPSSTSTCRCRSSPSTIPSSALRC